MFLRVIPAKRIEGICTVPGDKSISHRAALLGAIAEGTTEIKNFLEGADCLSTICCLKALGVQINVKNGVAFVQGKGIKALKEPEDVLDAGNSGTTIRMMLGLLAGQDFFAVITGDSSLRQRPMERVIKPLEKMGAHIIGRAGGTKAPLAIKGNPLLAPVMYELPVASAQVKSAILLAGLYAEGTTTVTQPAPSRDHTERMLKSFGASIEIDRLAVRLQGGGNLKGQKILIPGDISAAAFLMVGATIIPDSDILIKDVGINPTRTGIIDVLELMGANITVTDERVWNGEPVANIRVQYSRLKGVEIKGDMIPRIVDEIPVLAVAASLAEGVTEISDAAELRIKESDRLRAIANELKKMGAEIEEKPDGLRIEGVKTLRGAVMDSYDDHRIAMALTIAGLAANGESIINGIECVNISFPNFQELLLKLGANLEGW